MTTGKIPMIDNFKFAAKVIASCKTNEQLESCENWLLRISFMGDYLSQYLDYLELTKYIQEQRLYLNRLKEIGA